ncbi:glycosyltransferase family 2 protein [Panacibacter sp. DH6]|uniref:Glycosyltransferase family 2 protein n=1 Tax=Panacibacter microcysteis TaxID=2793269 RepID=A0A931E540_9BACT|nr:glycosyltransferase family 2 protein [Panacibacter microcysteis]MBG9375440.1 glycosyltransferase family 2 protein [Panacibacter microcysteis]
MKISGFTIIRNAIINDYPIVEAIRSILPVVDEMVVLIGDSEDDTTGLIKAINDPKIKIHYSTWDLSLRKGGRVLAVETDKAFQLIDPASDWAFYIQGDEVIHEQYLPAIKTACEKYKTDTNVEGLLFRYLHFYGTYDYVGDSRRWYHREVRIIRNDKRIAAYRDAQGFRIGQTKLKVKLIDACVYHYGWVKSPKQMKQKQQHVSRFWNEDSEEWRQYVQQEDAFNFDDFDSLQKFTGSHPAVMKDRIEKKNWNIDIDLSKKHFSLKDALLYRFEKLTSIRPFDFKNYRII